MGKYIDFYCKNDNKELKKIVNKILCNNFGWIPQKDYDDFYSIAGQVVWNCEKNFDELKNDNFKGYLTSCLLRKIKTQVTYMNRNKRKADMIAESIYQKLVGESERTLEDIVEDIEICEDKDAVEIEAVLKDICVLLKPKERKILELSIKEFTNEDIANRLNIEVKTVLDFKKRNKDRSDITRVLRIHGYLNI